MTPTDFFQQITHLFPKSFQPAGYWHGKVTKAIERWEPSERAATLEALTTRQRANKVLTIEDILDARVVRAQSQFTGSASGPMHEARRNPCLSVKTFSFVRSALRSDEKWAQFLDTIHPTAEQSFFVQAVLVGNRLEVPSTFRQEHILAKFADRMRAHFGEWIPVEVNKAARYDPLPSYL